MSGYRHGTDFFPVVPLIVPKIDAGKTDRVFLFRMPSSGSTYKVQSVGHAEEAAEAAGVAEFGDFRPSWRGKFNYKLRTLICREQKYKKIII